LQKRNLVELVRIENEKQLGRKLKDIQAGGERKRREGGEGIRG